MATFCLWSSMPVAIRALFLETPAAIGELLQETNLNYCQPQITSKSTCLHLQVLQILGLQHCCGKCSFTWPISNVQCCKPYPWNSWTFSQNHLPTRDFFGSKTISFELNLGLYSSGENMTISKINEHMEIRKKEELCRGFWISQRHTYGS